VNHAIKQRDGAFSPCTQDIKRNVRVRVKMLYRKKWRWRTDGFVRRQLEAAGMELAMTKHQARTS
jgi:hypothetical protein